MFVLIICLSTGDQVVGGEEIGADTEVEAEAEPIGIEIGIRLGAEEVLAAEVTKINCSCGYVFEYVLYMFAPSCGVVSKAIVGLFGDLFGGLLFSVIRLISGLFRYEPVLSLSGDSTYKDGFVNLAVVKGIDLVMVCLMAYIVYLLVVIINGFLYGVNEYFSCCNTEREKRIVLSTGIPSVTSHNIVLKFCDKVKDDSNVIPRWHDISKNKYHAKYNNESLIIF